MEESSPVKAIVTDAQSENDECWSSPRQKIGNVDGLSAEASIPILLDAVANVTVSPIKSPRRSMMRGEVEADTIAAERKPWRQSETYLLLLEKVKNLEDALITAEEANKTLLLAAQQRTERAKADLEEIKARILEEETRRMNQYLELKNKQEMKLREATDVIESLRRENHKLKTSLSKYQVKDHEMSTANEDIDLSRLDELDKMGEEVPDMMEANHRLERQIRDMKHCNHMLMKEVMVHQDVYMDQAESRLQYQKTLAAIMVAIQAKFLNQHVQENVIVIALGAESNAKSVMAELMALDIESHHDTYNQPPLDGSDVSAGDEDTDADDDDGERDVDDGSDDST